MVSKHIDRMIIHYSINKPNYNKFSKKKGLKFKKAPHFAKIWERLTLAHIKRLALSLKLSPLGHQDTTLFLHQGSTSNMNFQYLKGKIDVNGLIPIIALLLLHLPTR